MLGTRRSAAPGAGVGAAENNPDNVKKYIYETLPAVAGSETTVTTFRITPQCKIIYTQI